MTEEQIETVRAERLALDHLRQQTRASKPRWVRLHEAEDKALLLSTVPSAGISEYTTRGKSETREPPAQQHLDITDRLALVDHAIALLEDALDTEMGLGAAKEFATMRTEDLDKELLKWAGVPSFVVAVKAPWLGRTPRTIERARQRLNVRQSDGRELEAKQGKRVA